jgi:tetratricopeptide (TPR) repeat protein
MALTNHYRLKGNISNAEKFCETAISLAVATGNSKNHSRALIYFAWNKWYLLGDYFAGQASAYEAQRLARISADLLGEAQALQIASLCCQSLGSYQQSISLCIRARDLIALCGISNGNLDHHLMSAQADIHKLKSEYIAARSIHSIILQETSMDQDFYPYGFALLNIAEIDVSIGAPQDDVQSIYEKARETFNTHNFVAEVLMCDMILADLHLREGNFLAAKSFFESCIKSSLRGSDIMSYSLERLGNASRWGSPNWMSNWTTVFLMHSVRRKEKLGIYKALAFFGDVFLAQDDQHTATSLFTIALDGFTQMDVHQSRAECMLRLGDISKSHGNLLEAVELWETAKPLFERSSQTKEVKHVDERLASVSENVLEQHRKNLAHLAELNVPSTAVEEMDSMSDIEDIEGLGLDDEKELDLVAV